MPPTLSLFIAIASVALAALFTASPGGAELNLIFGTYTADKPTTTVRTFKPFLTYLASAMSERLGEKVTVSMAISRNYNDGIDALVKGQVDFARFGPASYVTAKQAEDGISIIAIESSKGEKTFKGIIAVHEDSTITSLADLKNGSFAFGSELSTIGRFLAQSELLDVDISAKDLNYFEYLGRHDRVGTAVGAGDFDAGALKSSTFAKLVKNKVPIRELVSFDNVTKPWLARADLDPTIVETMRRVMLETTDKEVLKSVSKSGFLEGNDQDYIAIRKAMIRSLEFGG